MQKNIVIVESPAKAKTINKYLGKDFEVIASYGHVRDLPPKDGSVDPDDGFAMKWAVNERGRKRIEEIAQAVKGASALYLATDPDREGEAISWHIQDELNGKDALKGVYVHRVVFNEITKNAVRDAFERPRAINSELVEAYLARRALDYLVGFTLSPVLWRKLPGSKSAGRVQSVALRLICDREAEIEVFVAKEFWTVDAGLNNGKGAFAARLTHLDGHKLGKFDLDAEAKAIEAAARLRTASFSVSGVENKTVRRNPNPPFITSTLQQEASRKLGFGVTRTMRTAQKLYEGVDFGGETVGLITYMRTDGVQLSQEAIDGARDRIARQFGQNYLPKEPRRYRSKQKNAQEAHEAIRPTDLSRTPDDIGASLDADQRRLYELIWKRTMACQMESAILDQMTVDIDAENSEATQGKAILRATGSTIKFKGFLALYEEGRDDEQEDEAGERRLPSLEPGQSLKLDAAGLKHRDATDPVAANRHFTIPPPRYTEASLVKRMEELGIGRPSTYASILQVLQDRDYVLLEKRRFVPEDRGRLVVEFLKNFFDRYVQYNFTADLENRLDEVSAGTVDWKALLSEFWRQFSAAVAETKDLRTGDVIDALDETLGAHFFPDKPDGADPRTCPVCGKNDEDGGRLSLRLGKFGAFIGCSNYPECRFTRQLTASKSDGDVSGAAMQNGPKHLGDDPQTGVPVSLRNGPYGPYVQLGPKDETDKEKPKRVSVPKGIAAADVALEVALKLLALPRAIGDHPETGKSISAGIGRYGPYLRHDGAYLSLPPDDDALSIGLNRAVTLIAEAPKKGRGGGTGKTLGDHPDDGAPVTLHSGRYGPYIKHGNLLASLPREADADSYSLDEAVALIAEKGKVSGGGRGKSTAKSKSKGGKKSTARSGASGKRKTAASGD